MSSATGQVIDWVVQPSESQPDKWNVRKAGRIVSTHNTQDAAKNEMMDRATSGDVIELRGEDFQTIWARQKR